MCVTVAAAFAFAGPASAFIESAGEPWGSTTTALPPGYDMGSCSNWACHGSPFFNQGPHGRYSSISDKCRACHDVHESPAPRQLLRAQTVLGLCNVCHDLSFTGTGGLGVYGAIRARGSTATARHSIEGYNETDTGYEATAVVPGGGTVLDLDGNPTKLTCGSCHTPHSNTVMPAFLGDRARSAGIPAPTTNKILQDDVHGEVKGTYTTYGTQWCAACHNRRHFNAAPGINNHPTNNSATWGYRDITYTPAGTGMGGTNAGYIMEPAPAGANGRVTARQYPICQQCHEDYRDAEAAFSVAGADGSPGGDNPEWQTFPHETLGANMLVETGDDLCLNCHPTDNLP